MKIIYDIAKAELRLLFYSPIAWLLLICFTMQSGLIFTRYLEHLVVIMQEDGMTYPASTYIFSNISLWSKVLDFLYFYIPLLTMGCISRDFSSGSIKLFYSSPITNGQIILGKYLSLLLYSLILMAVLAIYVVIAWCTIDHFEAGWIWSGWLGIFLVLAAYLAIGLFMSSLTSYQIIAAVCTFVVFMLLSMVKGWGQQYDLVRDITYWLSIDGRAYTFIQGLLCSEDIIYFVTIVGLFLSLTIIRLHALRQRQRWYITFGKNMVVVVVVCVIAFISSHPTLLAYYDATSIKKNTLTENSQHIVSKLDGKMTITAYVNILADYTAHQYPNFIIENQRFFRQYTRFKPDIKIKTVYYYAESDPDSLKVDPTGKKAWAKARLVCEKYDVDSTILKTKEEVDQMVDLSEEGYTFIWEMVRENGQKEWLRKYDFGFGNEPREAEITATMKRMVLPLPQIGYVVGHRERTLAEKAPQGYYQILGNRKCQFSVWNQGMEVDEITLDESISDKYKILLIADPREAFTEKEENILKEYIDRGGNLVVLGESRSRETLNPTIRRLLGVELTPMLAQNDVRYKRLPANILLTHRTNAMESENLFNWYKKFVMPTCAGVEVVEDKGFEMISMVETNQDTLCWTELETTDFIDDTIRYNPAIGEISKIFTTVMGLRRMVGTKEQRIVVLGDADCFSNNEFIEKRGVGGYNQYLMLDICYWLSEKEAPIDVRRPALSDRKIFMTMSTFKFIDFVLCWAIPTLMLGLYLFVWLRRRSR